MFTLKSLTGIHEIIRRPEETFDSDIVNEKSKSNSVRLKKTNKCCSFWIFREVK